MAYTLRVDDAFTVGSNTVITSHTPTTAGTGYTAFGTNSATGSQVLTVYSASGTPDSPFFGASQHDGYSADFSGTWADDQQISCVNLVAGSLQVMAGVRLQPGSTTGASGYVIRWNAGTNRYHISRIDNGSDTLANLDEYITTGSNAHRWLLRAEWNGSTNNLYAWLNPSDETLATGSMGTPDMSATDATYTGGKPGLTAHRTGDSSGIDDLKAYDQGAAAATPFGNLSLLGVGF